MSKYCSRCDREYPNSYGNYCSECGTKLESKFDCSSNYNDNLPEGYVYDWLGHQRPDPEYERRRKEELQRSFRDRW